MSSLYVLIGVLALASCYGNGVESKGIGASSADPVALMPSDSIACPNIVTRAEWGARPPTGTTWLSTPTPYAVIHHTDGNSCDTQASCEAIVRGIQDWHMDGNGWADIGYNFLIGGDGNVYEGRGWTTKGAHAQSYNAYSEGICMIGTYSTISPTATMQLTMDRFLECALSKGYIVPGYTLFGHRQAVSTTCPGDSLYSIVQAHPHYQYISGSVGNPLTSEQCTL